jgi:glycosyltransferase involved in cell wall biosynthesis
MPGRRIDLDGHSIISHPPRRASAGDSSVNSGGLHSLLAVITITTMQSKPRVCVVSTTPLIIHFFIRPHLLALAQRCDVTLILNMDNDTYAPPMNLPVRVVSLGIMRALAPLRDLVCLYRLYRLFHREKFDQIWAVVPKAGLLAMIAGRLAGVPSRVFVFQGEPWVTHTGVFRWILRTADRITAACATHLLAVSSSEKQLLESENIVAAGRLQVLGSGSICGVNLARFRPNEPTRHRVRGELKIASDTVVAVFIGRIKREKGVLDLCEAFSVMAKETQLHMVFVGPDEDEIGAQMDARLRECVSLVRRVGYTPEPERYIAAADFICLPSHREGFGMVVIEAAAMGIPAIGSRVSGVSDAMIDGVTGLQFEVGNIRQLTQVLIRLTNDAVLRREMGDAARARVAEKFEQTAVVERYVSFLADARL